MGTVARQVRTESGHVGKVSAAAQVELLDVPEGRHVRDAVAEAQV